jgi:hypothetical protein
LAGLDGVLTRRRLLLWGLGALLILSGASFAVGHFAARPGTGYLDWELASIFGTALGTTTLAVATGALAFTTSGEVGATRELARLTRQDQELRDRPVVVVSYTAASLKEGVPTFSLTCINIGLAPALEVPLLVEYAEPLPSGDWPFVNAQLGVLLVGDPKPVNITFPEIRTEAPDPKKLNVVGSVRDRVGRKHDIVLQSPLTNLDHRRPTPRS